MPGWLVIRLTAWSARVPPRRLRRLRGDAVVALEPVEGIPMMLRRTAKPVADHSLTRGPGNVSKALGLFTTHTGTSLLGGSIYIGDDGFRPRRAEIFAGPRIGVDYAGPDAELPYRFFMKGNPYVSGSKKINR